MVGVVSIHKPLGLFNKHFLLQEAIEEGTLDIHLVQFKLVHTRNGQEKPNGLQTGNGSKSLLKVDILKVDTLNLRVPLCYKSSLVPHYVAILIGFVRKYSFSAYDINGLRPRN